MATPKSLVFQLHKHWDLTEALVRASRELSTFTEDRIIAAIARHRSATETEAADATLRALCNADVLQVLPRTDTLQLNPLVLDFVRGLTREHELGLASVLKARVDAIRTATSQLHEGLETGDRDRLRQAAGQLMERFRRIGQQLDQDRHAILELAEQARSADSSMPFARRYRAILEAYDQYVEPMNEMMDTGPAGYFYQHLEAAERVLDRACEQLAQTLDHQLSAEDIALALGRPVDEIKRLLGLNERIASVDTPIGKDEDRALLDAFPGDNNLDPSRLLQDQDLRDQLECWLGQLSEKQRLVVERGFGLNGQECATLEQVGTEIGVTRERVRQIQIDAMRRMRVMLEGKGFSGELLRT